MRYQIEKFKPYQDSVRWQINHRYYDNQGPEVFLNREVPYLITNNSLIAAQNAKLIWTAYQRQEKPIQLRVLEIAGGLGIFALNFISALQALWKATYPETPVRLEYWLTDASLPLLQAVAQNAHIAQARESGILQLYQLDALKPDIVKNLAGQSQVLAPEYFHAVIANYHHCCFPMAIIYKDQNAYFERYSQTFLWLAGNTKQLPSVQDKQQIFKKLSEQLQNTNLESLKPELVPGLEKAIIQVSEQLKSSNLAHHWPLQADLKTALLQWLSAAYLRQESDPPTPQVLVNELKKSVVDPLFEKFELRQTQLEEQVYYQPLIPRADFSPDMDLLEKLYADLPTATFTYPLHSLKALEVLRPQVQAGGLILISDRGDSQLKSMAGLFNLSASIHGNSITHDVNFPLLEKWFQQQGDSVIWSQNRGASLQTLVAVKSQSLPLALNVCFKKVFKEKNLSFICRLIMDAGLAALENRRYERALFFFLKALQIRPGDAYNLIVIAQTYLDLKQPQKALEFLEQPHDDYYEVLDFDILRAEAYRELKDYKQALPCYEASMAKRVPDNPLVYLNYGRCLQALGKITTAEDYFQKAREQAGNDSKALQTIAYFSQIQNN